METTGTDKALYVDVAVPLPLRQPLTYSVPEGLVPIVSSGVRVRVRVGKRRMVGVVLAKRIEPPADVKLKRIDAVLDPRPVLTEELLNLAGETANYYLAPIGEVIRAMLPSDLPRWGDQRLRLATAALMLSPSSDLERRVVEHLTVEGEATLSDLAEKVALPNFAEEVAELAQKGRVLISRISRDSGRYVSAVELTKGERDDLLDRCGRSKPARSVVEHLLQIDRPATVRELCDDVGCGTGVIKRLVDLGVLRRFTQISKLPLSKHRTGKRETPEIVLRPDQATAASAIVDALDQGRYRSFLLNGVTGSGKTEVYLSAVDRVVEQGGSAIILVPEIALVPALASTVRTRYGEATALLHSALSKSERHQEWERIRSGEARVVVGPRSAVFAPVVDLQLIVVDEEQDPSYKQDQAPRYHGRDLAILRAHLRGAVVALVSATPSLESRHNSEIGKLAPLFLTQRVGTATLPEGVLVDLRAEAPPSRPGEIHFTAPLEGLIAETLAAGDQIILLRNRRGYSPLLLCRACGNDHRCDACGLPRTLHRKEDRLSCHYCGAVSGAPRICGECGEEALEAIGAGTERVEERFQEIFPGVPVGVLDRDTSRRGLAAGVLERFGRGESRVLIGTQMVSKGHHFPAVALTAVLLADTYLGFPDFRAVEKTYNLLTQLAGRAGRGQRPGKVVVQTYHPDHYAIRAALAHDDRLFANEEMRFRRVFHYPPYTRMVQLLLRDTNRSRAAKTMEIVCSSLEAHPLAEGVRIAGPAPAPFERLRGQWRFQILLRHSSGKRLRTIVDEAIPAKFAGDLIVDVDPHELL